MSTDNSLRSSSDMSAVRSLLSIPQQEHIFKKAGLQVLWNTQGWWDVTNPEPLSEYAERIRYWPGQTVWLAEDGACGVGIDSALQWLGKN